MAIHTALPSRNPNHASTKLLYAGVGSRLTPMPILGLMRKLGFRLAELGYTLRSGAADGADAAFEAGCDEAGGSKEIWLPWRGFNGHEDTSLFASTKHYAVASRLHPAWLSLKPSVRKLHARNVGQVLGSDLSTLVSFVLCWTPDGCESQSQRTRDTGGTGMAIALAGEHGVPVFNLHRIDALKRLAPLVRSKG